MAKIPPYHQRLSSRCRNAFDPIIRARGEQYFRQGLVSAPTIQQTQALLQVQGSRRYEIRVDWGRAHGPGVVLMSCSCPHYSGGEFCKHCWSALLQLDHAPIAASIPFGPKGPELTLLHETEASQRSVGFDDKEDDYDDTYENLASKPQWLQDLESIRRTTSSNARSAGADSGPRRQAFYSLDLDETRKTGLVSLEFHHRETLLSGEPSALRRHRVSRDDLKLYPEALDREILSLLLGNARGGHVSDYSHREQPFSAPGYSRGCIPAEIQEDILDKLATQGRLLIPSRKLASGADLIPLAFEISERWHLELELRDCGESFEIVGYFRTASRRVGVHEPLLCLRSGLLIFKDRIAGLQSQRHFEWIILLRGRREFKIPRDDCDAFVEEICADPMSPPIHWPEKLPWQKVAGSPLPRVLFTFPTRASGGPRGTSKGITCELEFSYEDQRIPAADSRTAVLDRAGRRIIERDPIQEQAFCEKLLALDGIEAMTPATSLRVSMADFARISSLLLSWGWPVEAMGKKIRQSSEFNIKVSSGVDWFDLKGQVSFGADDANSSGEKQAGEPPRISIPELLEAVREGQTMIKLGDGSFGILPEEWLKRYAPLISLGTVDSKEPGAIRFSRAQGAILSAWLEDEALAAHVETDLDFQALRKSIQAFSHIKPRAPSSAFKGTLRSYQKGGLAWLHTLRETSIGGILADDMGLGKTVQLLAHLDHEKRRLKAAERRPSLVILPKSLLFNWQEEAERFTPDLKVLCYAGLDREGLLKKIPKSDLVLITYSTLRQDLQKLRDFEFHYAIADEAQAIKNSDSLSHQACRLVRSRHRLALTGTPVENSFDDLVAILNFVNPGLLGTATQRKMARAAAVDKLDTATLEQLSRALKPFILRRTKDQVLKDLPPKTEQILHCELSPEEKRLYDELRDYYRANLKGEIDRNGLARSKFVVLEALLRLRQAACHPDLVKKGKNPGGSSKTELLIEQLTEITAEGHKALVFSQFTSFLEIVQKRLTDAGIAFEYLDGQTPAKERQERIAHFRDDPKTPVFLISLKAGGVGLNLTAADYVFILDPWWNPAVESQAIDRAHRIGQKNKVIAYRLIAQGTVEEKILELQKSKRQLADALITADASLLRNLTMEDLELLLS